MHPGARIPAMPVRRPSLPSLLPCGSRAGGNRPQGVRLHADRSKRVTAIIGSRAGCERRHQCLGPPMGASEVERAQVRREIGAIARSLGCTARCRARPLAQAMERSEEHTSELQSLMRISYAIFCLKKKINKNKLSHTTLRPHTHK